MDICRQLLVSQTIDHKVPEQNYARETKKKLDSIAEAKGEKRKSQKRSEKKIGRIYSLLEGVAITN